MQFVSWDLVLLAVLELGVPVQHHTVALRTGDLAE